MYMYMNNMADLYNLLSTVFNKTIITNTTTKTVLLTYFRGHPGWAGARRELLDFMVQGKINRGKHTDHPAGCHSIRTNQCPPPPSPKTITSIK